MKMRALVMVLGFSLVSAAAHAEKASVSPDCRQVCSEIRAFLKRDARHVNTEYQRWLERLSLKEDIVTYTGAETAALGLLRFMSRPHVTRAPENQMNEEFLTLLMNKCFPEASVDEYRARMSELVNIIWAARSLPIEKKIQSCK